MNGADPGINVRGYVAVFVAQLLLTGMAVAVAAADLGVKRGMVAVMAIATLDAALVAATFMHLRRERRWFLIGLAFVLFAVINLLFWPAWHEYERVRF